MQKLPKPLERSPEENAAETFRNVGKANHLGYSCLFIAELEASILKLISGKPYIGFEGFLAD
jgi:hypothetical protein